MKVGLLVAGEAQSLNRQKDWLTPRCRRHDSATPRSERSAIPAPAFVLSMRATLFDKSLEGPERIYEVK